MKATLMILLTATLCGQAHANTELYLHSGAIHSNNQTGQLSDDVFGLGIKRGNAEIGAYSHSYAKQADNGALGGVALYAMRQATRTVGAVDVGVFGGLTYGYPETLNLNQCGFMPIAGFVGEYKRARLAFVPATEKTSSTIMLSFRVAEF